jgi:hypothetical protein
VGMTAFLRNRAMDCTPSVLWPESVGAVGAQLKRTGRGISIVKSGLLQVDRRMAITNPVSRNGGRRQWKASVGSAVGYTPRGVSNAREK